MIKNLKIAFSIILGFFALFFNGCEDSSDEAVIPFVTFDITLIDVKSSGNSDLSQPELVRFVTSREGVMVNSKTNSLDFFCMSGKGLTIATKSITLSV